LVRRYDSASDPAEICRVYDSRGERLNGDLIPFARSVAGTAVSMQEPCVMNDVSTAPAGSVDLQPFERGRPSLLAVPLLVGPGVQAVIELFDSAAGKFRTEDQQLVRVAAEVGTELLRQALGQRQTQQILLDAVQAALGVSEQIAESMQVGTEERLEQPPPPAVLEQIKAGLSAPTGDEQIAEVNLLLAEAIRVLGLRHGR